MSRQELHPRTAVINKSQKNQSKKARNDALIWLATHFPQAFDNLLRIRPLKKGIMNDILAYVEQTDQKNISKSKLREAVVLFTRRIDYLICLKAREMRIDLQGNPVTPVTEEEAERAALKIKKRVEKSARNARNNLINKPSVYNQKTSTQTVRSDYLPQYPEHITSPEFHNPGTTRTTPPVIVKHKPSRPFDPDAIARLKQKLGLPLKSHQSKEPVD